MSSTLADVLADTVTAAPDSVAVIDGGPEPITVTRAELGARVLAMLADLRDHGVGEGDCIGVWLPNWSDSVVVQFAAAAAGAHVIGINTRYGVADVVHVLAHARPKVVVVAHDFLGLDLEERLRAAVGGSGAPAPAIAVVTGPGRAPATAGEAAAYDVGAGAWVPAPPTTDPGAPPVDMDGHRSGLDDLRAGPDALAVAFTTSGSTGNPKLAGHLGSAVARHIRHVAAAGGWDAGSVSLVVLPLSGVFGYVPAYTAIAAGGAALLEPTFDDDLVVAHMTRFGVTHLAGADDVAGRLMDRARARGDDLPRWRRMLLADFYGKSVQVAEWAEGETATPTTGIYGSSELFALTSFWAADDPLPTRWRGGGRPVSPEIEVRAVDPVTGGPPPGGEPGELQFRGYNVVDAYLGDDDGAIRARSFTGDGWFRTGDLGTVHPDGSFDYSGRMGDSLRLRGFLVEPAEIEVRLAAHPSVARTKVVGLAVDGDTRAIAFVEPLPGTTPQPAELRDWCAVALARFKVPDVVHVIEEMPTTVGTNGSKIKAAALRELAGRLQGVTP